MAIYTSKCMYTPKYMAYSVFLSFVSIGVLAEDVQKDSAIELSLRPAQCVSLNQGQTCYTNVNLRWSSQSQGSYCLHSSQQRKPLKCWSNQTSGAYKNEVASSTDVIFSIIRQDDHQIVAQKPLEVAWVYKKARRGYAVWRIF